MCGNIKSEHTKDKKCYATALEQEWLIETVPLPLSQAGGHFCVTGNCRVRCLPGKRGTSLSNNIYV